MSASVIVLAVLAFAVYSANAGSGQDRMRRAAEDAARSAKAAIAAAGRVSQLYISADGLDRPVSYMALIRIHGWKNREQRVIDASVDTVRALDGGEVNATAVSSGSVADAIADQITGKRVLASVDPRIAADMPEDGDAQVRLIVSPNGATATLVIDEVIEPIQLKGAGMAPAGRPSEWPVLRPRRRRRAHRVPSARSLESARYPPMSRGRERSSPSTAATSARRWVPAA